MSTLKDAILKTVASYDKARTAILALAEKYLVEIPADLCWCYLAGEAHLEINMGLAPNEAGRMKLLYYIGKAWGADGWMRAESGDRRFFKWEKVLDGVRIIINSAEPIPEYKAPVPASAFPLMLAEESDIPA